MRLEKGTIKRIHVNRQVLATNKRSGANESAITIQTSKGPIRASHVSVVGNGFMVQAGVNGRKPLSCGARVWLETTAEVFYTP